MKITIAIPALLIILSLCVRTPVLLQTQDPTQSVDLIKISTDLVLVDVLAINQSTGSVIGNLRPDDFLLYEDKVRQTITHFSLDRLPLALVLTVDVGMSIQEELPLHQELLVALEGLKPEDEVALMAFDFARVRLMEDFTRDRKLIADRLATIRSDFLQKTRIGRSNVGMRPGSAINQAIYDAATLLNQHHKPGLRTAIIAVTPDDQPAQFPFTGKSQKDVLEVLFEPGTTVNGLVLPSYRIGGYNPLNVMFARGSVGKYAEQTGGDLVKVDGNNAGKKLSNAIARLRARYTLGYLPTNEKWDGKYRRIEVTLAPEVERREGKVIVKARKGYFANRPSHASLGKSNSK